MPPTKNPKHAKLATQGRTVDKFPLEGSKYVRPETVAVTAKSKPRPIDFVVLVIAV